MGGGSSSATTKHLPQGNGTASIRSGSFTVSIPKSMAGEAAEAAKELGITKAQLVKRALADMLEDIHDMKIIEERRGEKNISWEQVKANLGL